MCRSLEPAGLRRPDYARSDPLHFRRPDHVEATTRASRIDAHPAAIARKHAQQISWHEVVCWFPGLVADESKHRANLVLGQLPVLYPGVCLEDAGTAVARSPIGVFVHKPSPLDPAHPWDCSRKRDHATDCTRSRHFEPDHDPIADFDHD